MKASWVALNIFKKIVTVIVKNVNNHISILIQLFNYTSLFFPLNLIMYFCTFKSVKYMTEVLPLKIQSLKSFNK